MSGSTSPLATTATCCWSGWPPTRIRSCARCGRPWPARPSAADEEAARAVGSRRTVARAIGKAALVSRGTPVPTLAAFAAPGPLPRRVAALLGPEPAVRTWPPLFTAVGMALWTAATGALLSAMFSASSAVTLLLLLHAATPW